MRKHEHGISRRDLFRLGLTGGSALVATACGWDGGPTLEPKLRLVSSANDWIGARLFSKTKLAPTYPISQRATSMPGYFVSKEMPTLEHPETWQLQVGGLVKAPQAFNLAALMALPAVTYTVKHHCVEGWTSINTWTGVPLSTIASIVQTVPAARYVRFESFDSGYMNGWDIESALHPQTLLAYAYNDKPLMPMHGAPVRLYSPVKLGYKLTKYLTTVTFGTQKSGGYWEDQGYPWFGGI